MEVVGTRTTQALRSIRLAGVTVISAAMAATLACTTAAPSAQQTADTIYAGGDIVTVNDAQPTAEALAVKDGKILAVSTRSEVERVHKGTSTHAVDLAGRTLVPGFVDGHVHMFQFGAQAVGANLLSPPDGTVNTINDVVAKLQEFAKGPDVKRTGWITLDGSPQGRTAWRTVPYLLPPDGQKPGYKGYPAFPDEKVLQALFDEAYHNKWQVLTHANGDAAVDQMIRGIRAAQANHGPTDLRPVLIHGQYIRQDQLDALKELNIIPSLFPMHTFYWGDWHAQIIGLELAQQISPMQSALKRSQIVTSHTDAPAAVPNLMFLMWTAVNRVSRSGRVIGPNERLTPIEALKSITLWGAYQHFEEKTKGSLEVGKLADLVILDRNPLKGDPMTIKDIDVVETIKEGKTVYRIKP